jgi:hypothetical protein
MNPNEILNKILVHYKINYNKLATELGLKRTQNLYDIRDGKTGISKKLANQITKWKPEINALWLLTGKGEMIKNVITQNNVEGDNIQGHNVTVKKTETEKFLDLLQAKDEQMNRLIGIIEKLNK